MGADHRPSHPRRVVALLTDPGRRTNNRGTEPKYLLTSIAHCGVCGGALVGTNEYTYVLKNGRTRVYPHSYACAHAGCMKVRRLMADVDDLVTRVAIGVLKRDGVRLLGGDPTAAAHARDRIGALEAKLALAADQFADDTITGDQLRRVSERLKPQLAQERARLAAAQPNPELAAFAGTTVDDAWDAADVETRKRIIRVLGMRITIKPIGSGNGSTFDPESVSIGWPPPGSGTADAGTGDQVEVRPSARMTPRSASTTGWKTSSTGRPVGACTGRGSGTG